MFQKRLFATCLAAREGTRLSGKYTFVKCPEPVTDTGCTYCKLPWLPWGKGINYNRTLRNSAVPLYKHVLVLSGLPDHEKWPKRFEMSPESVISDLTMMKRKYTDGYHPSLISMTSLSEGNCDPSKSVLLGLYPDGISVEVPRENLKDFVEAYLGGNEGEKIENLRKELKTQKLSKDYILVCGHTARDIRCAKIGPMVVDEFRKAMELDHIPETQAEVGFISHVGGHVFAANVLIFKHNGDVLWYGRVEPKHVQGIVKKSVLGNEIIEELYRG